ncbi:MULTISPECIES: DUF1796 family putative cysteine peptidase [Bacillus cereus group]|uniref:Amino acid permease n=1 Tax=Bacillus thuringiensis subsp. konkukian (strain 97-27) TaxID=281309 RepID=Q6HCP2_BACHK|nr:MULTISPECIES: DUF1796 family putative cysteine peptidase [Bacillus cereus group]AAT60916.1 hypothetical protein BT9727_4369 [[Bacillus thuringiensis] serovar konkukian str. 97-27]AJI32589.1 hypothetical protein BG06_3330 [Bacillus thuringiensis]MDA1522019.1 DUF1796 family putative cysteine peptidase [Bacillus cereus]QKI26961.1 amino acid permease [Bacillus thuringiensis]
MKLSNIKKCYNIAFSLGENCWPAWALDQFGLARFFGVIDFMLSPSLDNVNLLLKNRFHRFLDYENLLFISYWEENNIKLRLRDSIYEIDSCHDFHTDVNTKNYWPSYEKIKLNYEHRINRFLNTIKTEQSILFIRTGGTYEEAHTLQHILSQMVKHDFSVLLLIPAEVPKPIEQDWGLENICVVKCPVIDLSHYNDDFWKELLDGITISSAN